MDGNLNPEQREAVHYESGPLLVLAGAGSGKTRVIAHRIAFLVKRCGVPPREILAITFTRKAAGEMRKRIEELLGLRVFGMWIGTFHSVCARILRSDAPRLDYRRDFTIYDEDDQRRLMKRVIKELEISEREFPPARVLEKISSFKAELVDVEEAHKLAVSYYEKTVARIYGAYQEALRKNNAMDFDDLLVNTVTLLTRFPDVRDSYARRFKHVLVDEYQDTNRAQYRIIAELCRENRSLCVVGDDDQSIYGWRGADIRNILEFEENFPEARVVRLEENYRSTGLILDAANQVIRNNKGRKGKTLRTRNAYGDKILLMLLPSEDDEAHVVAQEIEREHREHDTPLSEMAVLYRTNAQSRALEIAMRHAGIRYQVVGSTSFYERKEVKDILAYLRVCLNPYDEISLRRIINVPPRRIGDVAMTRVSDVARERGVTLLKVLRTAETVVELPAIARRGIRDFVSTIDELNERRGEDIETLIQYVVERVGYREYLKQTLPNYEDRLENLDELTASGREFEPDSLKEEGRSETPLEAFLNDIALVSQIDTWHPDEDKVTLMTAHNAKGLEFSCVFVTGLEDGLFPHMASMESREELEEERRLFYVALTRAKRRAILTAAARRRRFDARWDVGLSRFVLEIPEKLIATKELWDVSAPSSAVGHEVCHDEFGRGTVIAQEGSGDDAKLTIQFGSVGVKKILARYVHPEET